MKLVKFDLAGQKQTWEVYESEAEYQKIEKIIEKFWGKPVINPVMLISNILPRKYKII